MEQAVNIETQIANDESKTKKSNTQQLLHIYSQQSEAAHTRHTELAQARESLYQTNLSRVEDNLRKKNKLLLMLKLAAFGLVLFGATWLYFGV